MTHVGIMATNRKQTFVNLVCWESCHRPPRPLPLLCNLVSGGSDILDRGEDHLLIKKQSAGSEAEGNTADVTSAGATRVSSLSSPF